MAFKNKPTRAPRRDNEPLKLTGRSVYVRDGEDPTRTFKKLTRKLKDDGFFEKLRSLEFYEKPSEKAKTQSARAKSRERKRIQKLEELGPIAKSIRNKSNRGKKTKRREK